jgi:L-rhamnose mutarotase
VGGDGPLMHRDSVTRFGQLIHVRPDRVAEYEALHAAPWPEVLAAIHRANIRNYSIFRHGDLLFAYFEYIGHDFAADMAGMAADPVVQRWWQLTDAMQEPFAEREPGAWWLTIPEVFHTD